MKKRLLMLIMCICLGLSMNACGKSVQNQDTNDEQENVKEESDEDKKEDKSDKDDTSKEIEKSDIVNIFKYNKLPAFIINDDFKLQLWNNGRIIMLDELKQNEEGSYYYGVREVIGDYVYAIKTTYFANNNNACLNVYDLEGNEVFEHYFESDSEAFSVVPYMDKICVVYRANSSQYESNGTEYRVYVYEPSNHNISYDKELSEVVNKTNRENILYPSYGATIFDSINNDSDEIYAWDNAKNEFQILNQDSFEVEKTVACDIAQKEPYCVDFVGDYAVLCASESYIRSDYYVADMRTGETKLIYEDGESSYICAKDGYVYYYPTDEEAYRNVTNNVYSYNVATGESKLLYSVKTLSGSNIVSAGVSDFKVQDNIILFKDADEKGYFWRVYDLKSGKLSEDKISYTEYDYSKYATVEALDYTKSENHGGKDVKYFGGFVEKVTLNSDIQSADKINADLEQLYKSEVDYCKERENDAHGWLAEVEDTDYFFRCTYDYELASIRKLGADYLQIVLNAYEYNGGAHGYGSNTIILYRLSTGEKVTLKDICGVDFETYKRILIAKTIDDWKSCGDYKYYNSYSYESEYESTFYETLMEDIQDFESFDVTFYEDHLVVSYPPYMYGPYASGYIDIEISYDELCIDINK